MIWMYMENINWWKINLKKILLEYAKINSKKKAV